jgi:hypothetical protein
MDEQRFPIRFTSANRLMAVFGVTPGNSFVEVAPNEVIVRLGWAFRARIPRSSIRSVEPDRARVTGWGAHGWRGEWLVNGSSKGIVRIVIDPPASASCAGVPVKLRTLRVSLVDPDGFRAAVGPG